MCGVVGRGGRRSVWDARPTPPIAEPQPPQSGRPKPPPSASVLAFARWCAGGAAARVGGGGASVQPSSSSPASIHSPSMRWQSSSSLGPRRPGAAGTLGISDMLRQVWFMQLERAKVLGGACKTLASYPQLGPGPQLEQKENDCQGLQAIRGMRGILSTPGILSAHIHTTARTRATPHKPAQSWGAVAPQRAARCTSYSWCRRHHHHRRRHSRPQRCRGRTGLAIGGVTWSGGVCSYRKRG